MNRKRQLAVAVCVVVLGVLFFAVRQHDGEHVTVEVDAAKMAHYGLSPLVVAATKPGPPVERPNVVLVIVCTLRKDQLSVYGAPLRNSPFLQSVAEQGATFDNAYAASTWTRTASTAIMTGYHPVQVGMVEPASSASQRRLSEAVDTLAESFQRNGYRTVGVTTNPNTNGVFGFAQGFDDYVEMTKLWREAGHTKVPGFKAVAAALDAVDASAQVAADKPLYLRVMLLDPHTPIRLSRADAAPYMDDDTPPRLGKYRVMVARSDLAISQLWEGLAQRGLDESNTILSVISDHGEGLSFPPHHGVGHGNLTYSATAAMPWIVHGPGVKPGHRIGGMASQVDVLPTLQELAGFDAYEGPGHSWLPQLRGAPDTSRSEAFVDTWKIKSSRAAVYTEARSCHVDFRDDESDADRQRAFPREACYDETADAYQLTEVAPDASLLQTLRSWRAARKAEFDRWPHHENAQIESSVRAHLEALGYVQADE